MYKKVKKYAQQNNFKVEDKSGIIYGEMNGVFIMIQQDPAVLAKHTVMLWVKAGGMDPVPSVVDYLNQCTAKYKYLQTASYSGTKIIAEFQGLGFQWGKNYVPCLDEFLRDITAYCRNNQLVQCCESCQGESSLSLYQVDGVGHLFCSSCYASVAEQIQRTKHEKKKRSGNVVGGIVGALLGALIGGVLWVLVYQLGYISAIAGAVMIICALKGYELLGGKLSKAGVIISCIISIAMVLVAEQVSLGIAVFDAYKDYVEISFFDAFRAVPDFLQEPEIMSSVVRDVIIGYVLMAVGAWGTIRQALKKSSGNIDTRVVTTINGSSNDGDVHRF